MKKTFIISSSLLTIGFFFVWAQSAFAMDAEFYTYNGFGPVAQAFTKISLIFADGGYQGLFFSIIILGIVAAFFSFMLKSATGARLMPLSWVYPILGGVMIYLALFVPKGNITVYDPVLNRFQTIGGIPNGVVFTAGILNKIERGLVDIIDTAGVPGSKYQEGAGGIGFTALKEAMNASVKNNYLQQSLAQYMEDCVMFEMTLPGTTFDVDAVTYTTTNYLTEFAKANNPAIYTVYYDSTNKAGVTTTCADSWTSLNAILSAPATYADSLKAVCGATLYNSASPLELQKCKDLMSNTLLSTTGISAQPEDLVRQGFISQIIYEVISKADPNVTMALQGNRQIVSSGMGMASSLNEWLPIMRAIMTAIAIGLIPFLVLFIPTPLCGKGLGAMAGFFVFLTTWGIADAIVHGAAMDYATTAMEDIRQSGLGLATCLNFPENSTKIMGMFGMIRGSSIMLASFLTTMLVKFGGHALAMISGNLQGAVAGGGQAAARTLTPEGHAQAKEQMINASQADGWMNSNKFGEMSRGGTTARNMATQANTAGFDAQYQGYQQAGGTGSRQEFMAAKSSEGSFVNRDGSKTSVMGATGASTAASAPDPITGITKTSQTGPSGITTSQYKQGDAIAATSVTGADGKEVFTSVKMANVSKLGMGHQVQNSMITKGAEGMSSTENYSALKSYAASHADSNSHAQQFQTSLSNSESKNFSKAIKDGSMVQGIHDQQLQKALSAEGGVSLDKFTGGIIKAGAGYKVSTTASDGTRSTVSLTKEEAETLQNNIQRVRTQSLSDTMQNTDNLTFGVQASQNIGATKSASYLKEAQNRVTDSAAFEANLVLAATREVANRDFDGNMMQAANFINQTAHNSGMSARLSAYAEKNMMDNAGVPAFIEQKQTDINTNQAALINSDNVKLALGADTRTPTPGNISMKPQEQLVSPDMGTGKINATGEILADKYAGSSNNSTTGSPLHNLSRTIGKTLLDDGNNETVWTPSARDSVPTINTIEPGTNQSSAEKSNASPGASGDGKNVRPGKK
ncbi:MAG: hypothetical protein A2511_09975 [Deltaproteobacteria bacterium RIFOXYD12_FULL_50_9]|nr:MAG: hypothetical protein A2511_09975 [Deltaproteobacteria bacterium RIFOXYD12_FULL_50_9]